MKTEPQIRHKLKQVLYRHLKKRLSRDLAEVPSNCRHNLRLAVEGDQTIAICGYSQNGVPRGIICDERIEGCRAMAKECPLFEVVVSKADIKADFDDFLHSANRGEIAARFSDAAALLWVLEDGVLPAQGDIQVEDDRLDEQEPDAQPSMGWFRRLFGGRP